MRDFLWIFLAVFFLHEFSIAVQLLVASGLIIRLLYQKRWKCILVFLLLLLRINVLPESFNVDSLDGRVSKLYENSFLLKTRSGDVLVVSDRKPILDSSVQVQGEFQPIDLSSHFFETEHIADAMIYPENIHLLKERCTLRSWIHQRIRSIEDEASQNLMLRGLLRCSTAHDSGLISVVQLSYLLHLLSKLLTSFCDLKVREKIEIVLILLLTLLWDIPWTGFRLLYFRQIKKSNLSTIESLGLYCVLQLLFDPGYVDTSSFWFSILLRLSFLCFAHRRTGLLWSIVICQLCFYASCDLVEVALMPVTQLFSVFSFCFCFLRLFFSFSLSQWTQWQLIFNNLPSFELHGTASLLIILIILYCVSFQTQRFQQFLAAGSIAVCAVCSFQLFDRIVFLNVGQGDAILIQAPFKHLTVLIDTGPPSSAYQLKKSLCAQSVYEIDLLICTHQDADHSGNIEFLKKEFDVKEVWDNTMDKQEDGRLSMRQINELTFEHNENDRSLILVFKMNGLSFLFSGDASSSIEEKAAQKLDETIDVCKIAHHGSNTSTSMKVLDKLQCDLAIISAGAENRYGHPHQEVLNRLEINGSTVLSTQNQGDIALVMTRFFNLITTSNHEFGIIS